MNLFMNEEGPVLNRFFAQRALKENYTEERASFLEDLLDSARQGHLCLRREEVPSMPDSVLEEGKNLDPKAIVIRQKDRYYLQKNWILETYILQQILRLSSSSPIPLEKGEPSDAQWEEANLLPMQKKGVEKGLNSRFSVLCGGPGTGKTYTASRLVPLFIAQAGEKKCRIVAAAPTGKAVSHLQSVLSDSRVESATLHRLLRITPGEVSLFSQKKIDADLVIVDEASMIDALLFARLLEAIGERTRLVLMGDPHQLPPVGEGSLFPEIASLFGTFLETGMRAENEKLNRLAEQIRKGEEIDPSYFLNWPFDSSLPKRLFRTIPPAVFETEPDPAVCLNDLNRFRILGALRQGPFGIEALNRQMVEEIDRSIQVGQWWAVPILITSNRPDQGLYNGTSGVLIGKRKQGFDLREGTAYFSELPSPLSFGELPPFEVAFCLSIHKSQGSEFQTVIALFPEGSEHFGKQAFYTAVTRAKKEVKIAIEPSILKKMFGKDSLKTSGFRERFLLAKNDPFLL